jgi:nucleotide-binding universal stress UspA family protein
MAIARILVPLTGAKRDREALGAAFAAAKLFTAHVEAIFVKPDPVEAMPFYGEGMSSAVMQEIMNVTKNSADSASRAARANCEALARDNQVEIIARPKRHDSPTVSFGEVQGNLPTQVAQYARLSDLVVFGPIGEDDRPGLGDAFDSTLMETGRPVLLAGAQMAKDFAAKIALAWNGSTASAHAASAALPFLKKAQSVEILTVSRGNSQPVPADELQFYLGLHGVEATARTVDGGSAPIADVLLKAAESGGNSMLVAGGYGHNRMREFFVTGVTRRVIAQAALPCFLVH